jgi:hypothetical protein
LIFARAAWACVSVTSNGLHTNIGLGKIFLIRKDSTIHSKHDALFRSSFSPKSKPFFGQKPFVVLTPRGYSIEIKA